MVRLSLISGLAVGIAISVVGCNGSNDYKPANQVKKAPPLNEHDHDAKGPHGGSIIELGEEEYHAEIVVDHDSESVAVYVLGKDAKTPEQVTATEVSVAPAGEGKESLTLKAAPQQGDAEGKTSKFELKNEDVVHALLKEGMLHGKLRITIGDKPYIGDIDYHLDGSDHHDHDEKKADAVK